MTENMTLEPLIDLTAMARIVRDLLAGGEERLRDAGRLHTHAVAAGLDGHACAALEALRQRLCRRGMALLDATAITPWN
jgi:hypothetical protein